jgi:hypothetical protein
MAAPELPLFGIRRKRAEKKIQTAGLCHRDTAAPQGTTKTRKAPKALPRAGEKNQ